MRKRISRQEGPTRSSMSQNGNKASVTSAVGLRGELPDEVVWPHMVFTVPVWAWPPTIHSRWKINASF